MEKDGFLRERIRVIISDLIARNDITIVNFAKEMGCAKNSISLYMEKALTPTPEFISKLALDFHVSLNWLYFGVGEMYQDMESGFEEPPAFARGYALAPDAPLDPWERLEGVAESLGIPYDTPGLYKRLWIPKTLEKAAEILSSNTIQANCLFTNIEYID